MRLRYRPPYDWDAMLAFLARPRHPRRRGGVSADRYRAHHRASAAHSGVIMRRSRPAEHRRQRRGAISRSAPRCRRIIARVRRVFDLAADPAPIGAHLARTRRWRRWSRRGRACACPAPGTASSSRCAPILGQQITVSRPRRLAGKLVAAYGERVAGTGARRRGPDAICSRRPRGSLRPISPRSACPGRARGGAGVAGARPSPPIRPSSAAREPRRGDREAALAAGDRRMDGAIHRHARAARARRVSRRRYRPAARDGATATAGARRRPMLSRAERWRPWRAYAALHLWAAGSPSRRTLPGSRREREAA